MMMASDENKTVCVTGAGGYVASWLVKLLLSKGYVVHGTVRDSGDEKKNAHLFRLEKAAENLKLFKADLLDYNSLCSAIDGCVGIFHVASPLPPWSAHLENPQAGVIVPAVKGTLNVLQACFEAKIKRVIVVSSGTAVLFNPKWPEDRLKDHTCYSDKEFLKEKKLWYPLSKIEAETQAAEFCKRNGLDLVVVCPGLVYGPMLQSTVNASSLILINLMKEGYDRIENELQKLIDVRDVAEGLLVAYETPEAQVRYICAAHMIKTKDLVEKLKSLYPTYKYPKSFYEVEEEPPLTSEKLQNLGWKHRPLEETLVDAVECYKQAKLLD